MALRTTFQSGPLATGSTWVGGVAPVAGDRVAIGHVVTVDAAATVGASAGSDLAGTGTVGTGGASSTALAGVGTAFATQLHPGDLLSTSAGLLGVVAAIGSDTALTLAEAVTLAAGTAFTYTPAAIYLTGAGARLAVNAPLTVRGALVHNTPFDTTVDRVAVSACAGIEFDASTASDPANTHYPWLPIAANFLSDRVAFNGTSGSRCYLRSNAGGGPAYFTTGAWAYYGFLRLTGTDVTRIGDATRDAFYVAPYTYAVVELVVSGCRFTSCGRFNLPANLQAATILQFLGTTWTGTLHATDCLLLYGGTGATDGTSDIRGCVFDKKLNGYVNGLTIGGPGAGDWNVFQSGYTISSAGAWTAFRGNLVQFRGDQSGGLGSAGDVTDCYFLADVSIAGNPHYLFGRPEGPSTFAGLIFEYAGVEVTGDCTLTAGQTLTLRNCIKLPNAAGGSSGTMVTGLNPLVDMIDLEHCTFHGGGEIDSSGARIDNRAPAGMMTSFRGNLYWDTAVQGFKLCVSGTSGSVAEHDDAVSAADADYNGGWKFAAGSNGKGYNGLTFSSGAPGGHDVEADPRFVWQVLGLDPMATPNVLGLGGWDASLGGPGTVVHALAELAKKNDGAGYNPAYNPAALLAWVRAMHRPTNPVYAGATYPGDPATADAAGNPLLGTVGAMAYLQPASDYTLSGPASGVPGGVSAPFTVALAYGVDPGGTVTVTPAVSGFTGTFTPTSVTLSNTIREATFTLTPAAGTAAGTVGSVSVADSGTLTDPGPVVYTVAYDPPSGLAAWAANMQWSATGQPNAYPPAAGVWLDGYDHYDPIRVFQNVRDYTGDVGWEVQIAAAVHRYRDQAVRPGGGGLDSVHAWATGLARHYRDTTQVASREAGILIRRSSFTSREAVPIVYSVLWPGSRELAFAMLNHLGCEDLGYSPTTKIHDMATAAVGHIDQWTWGAAGSPYTAIGPRPIYVMVQCFMIGITCEALIAYWDRYGDAQVAGIPAKVKQALDWLWDNAYMPLDRTMPYYQGNPYADVIATTTGTITSVDPVNPTLIFSGDSGLSPHNGAYSGNRPGMLTFTSGARAGETCYTAPYAAGYVGATRTFACNPNLPVLSGPPGVGDAFTLEYLRFDVGTVATADPDRLHITAASGINTTSGHYVFAELYFSTGSQAGLYVTASAYDGPTRAFVLYDPTQHLTAAPAPGDTFLLRTGFAFDGTAASAGLPDSVLNFFPGPAYAWYYRHTARQGARDSTYRTRHDLLFAGSWAVVAPGGNLITTKDYSQQYRLSPQGLKWRADGDIAWPPATHLRLAAPTTPSGRANAWSGPFRLRLSDAGDTGADVGLGPTDRVTVTLSDGGAGGTFSPAAPVLTAAHPWAIPRYRPAVGLANGTVVSITATATGLTAPAAVAYTIAGGSAPTATGYTFTGPATGPVGSASGPFTFALTPAGSVPDATIDAIGGILAVGNSDGTQYTTRYQLVGLDVTGAGAIALSGDNPAPQFTYTAPAAGTYTLQGYADPAQAGDPTTLTYTAADAPPAFAAGINFRATAPYVTDGTDQTYCLADAYPTTRAGLTFGWSGSGIAAYDGDASGTYAPELAGGNYANASNGPAEFQLDLPAAGTYAVRLALGATFDTSYATISCRILDGPGGPVLATVVAGATGGTAGQYHDATGVLRTSPAGWRANNAAATVTTTGTALVVRIAETAIGASVHTLIAHLGVTGGGGGGMTTSTLTQGGDSFLAGARILAHTSTALVRATFARTQGTNVLTRQLRAAPHGADTYLIPGDPPGTYRQTTSIGLTSPGKDEALALVVDDDPLAGHVRWPGDIVRYRFIVDEPGSYAVTVSGIEGPRDPVEMILWLHREELFPAGHFDERSGPVGNPYIAMDLTPGRYLVRVAHREGSAMARFQIRVWRTA